MLGSCFVLMGLAEAAGKSSHPLGARALRCVRALKLQRACIQRVCGGRARGKGASVRLGAQHGLGVSCLVLLHVLNEYHMFGCSHAVYSQLLAIVR